MVVQRVGDELLAGARFAPDEHGGAGAHDLRDLLEHPAHRPAGPDEVGELVALLQLLAELGVLLHQLAALQIDEPLDPERLRDHAGRDPERLDPSLGLAVGMPDQLDAKGARGGAVEHDGHTEEGGLLGTLGAVRGTVQEARLPTHFRHHRRRPRLGDGAGDPFAHPVADPAPTGRIPQRRLHREEPAVLLQQRHRAADGPAAPFQHLEHGVEPGREVQGSGERLAHLHQHRELPDVGDFAGCGRLGRGRRGRLLVRSGAARGSAFGE